MFDCIGTDLNFEVNLVCNKTVLCCSITDTYYSVAVHFSINIFSVTLSVVA